MPQRILFGFLILLLGGSAFYAFGRQQAVAPPATPPQVDMEEAARAFLATLDEDARARAFMPFDSDERFNWHYIPRERLGLPIKAMTEPQRKAAHALLQSALSKKGYERATNVMEMEHILGLLENRPDYRDPENYYVTIFGTPSAETPWGWRFEGHHLSLNFSSVTDEVTASTPAFFGANPARVPEGERKGWRSLAAEEDRARALLGMLTDAQRNKVIISRTAPGDIITGADRHAHLEQFEGLSAAEMTPPQRDSLLYIIEEYTDAMRPDVAAVEWKKIEDAGIDKLYFAWAGSLERSQGHYYRIHGPTFLIEYDNTQNNANHVHAVWRGFDHDFGEDLLLEHYQESHQH